MSFRELLKNCRNPDQTIRNNAELELDRIGTENFSVLMHQCAMELADEGSPKENRQLSATIIKNMICFQKKHQGKWEQMPVEEKNEIKRGIICCLASELKEIRKATALTVAGICRLEIPRGEWPEVINILVNTALNDNLNIRNAAIITIGYVSQELLPGQLTSSDVDGIMSSLIENLNHSDLEVVTNAIVAFLSFLIFAKKNIEIPDDRNVVFDIIFRCLQNQSVDVRVYAMQCLVEISRMYYDCLETHIDQILNITEFHMLQDDERVAIQAYEFWCSVSDEEVSRISRSQPFKGYCQYYVAQLFEIIKSHLLNRTENEDEDSWSRVKGASCLLTNLSMCTQDYIVDQIFNLIKTNMTSPNAKIRDSILLAYGSILETKEKEKIQTAAVGSIETLINYLSDVSNEVRNTSAWCIKRICELHPTPLIEDAQVFQSLMAAILANLRNTKKVVIQICEAIHHLAFSFKCEVGNTPSSTPISPCMKDLLYSLIEVCFTKNAFDPNNNIALAGFYSIGSLVENAPLDTYPILFDFFSPIIEAFQSTFNSSSFESNEVRYSYQAYISTVISALTAAEKVKINSDQVSYVYNLIKQSFNERSAVYEEGLMACSSLALSSGKDFYVIMADFYTFLNYALSNWQDASQCRIAINSASDLIRALGSDINQYIPGILERILTILTSEASDRVLKTQSFIVITDIFCYARDIALSYYSQVMGIISNALLAAAVLPIGNDDPDFVEYSKKLREHLIECLTCVIHCVKDVQRPDIFENYIEVTLKFIETIIDERFEPSIDILTGSLGIIGDLCELYQHGMKQVLNSNLCGHLIEKIRRDKFQKWESLCEWASQNDDD